MIKTTTSPPQTLPKDTKQANHKKAKQFKQLLRMMNELNQDIYICIQDKKSGSIHQFSSDLNKFGNVHIAEQTKEKNASLHKIEKFNAQLIKLQDKQLKASRQSCNESSADSKKPTEASAADTKSDVSKISPVDNLTLSDIDTRYTPLEFNSTKNEV